MKPYHLTHTGPYCHQASDFLKIDRRTALNLELINNARTGKQSDSLFGTINRTKTAGGARFLRSQLLRPSCDVPTINARLDAVSFLLDHEELLETTGENLKRNRARSIAWAVIALWGFHSQAVRA